MLRARRGAREPKRHLTECLSRAGLEAPRGTASKETTTSRKERRGDDPSPAGEPLGLESVHRLNLERPSGREVAAVGDNVGYGRDVLVEEKEPTPTMELAAGSGVVTDGGWWWWWWWWGGAPSRGRVTIIETLN